jgi:hypothetical protein
VPAAFIPSCGRNLSDCRQTLTDHEQQWRTMFWDILSAQVSHEFISLLTCLCDITYVLPLIAWCHIIGALIDSRRAHVITMINSIYPLFPSMNVQHKVS